MAFKWYDRDIAPEGATLRESVHNLHAMVDVLGEKQQQTGMKLLWGGREGYETQLNTRMGQELEQMGRFLNRVVEYKHKIGFKGAILIEPKPREPTKHQYDYDVATVYGSLCRFGLDGWASPEAQGILAGKVTLDGLAAQVLAGGADPRPVSGRQEYRENLLNAFI